MQLTPDRTGASTAEPMNTTSNTALQRTRSAPLRSPLSFWTLGHGRMSEAPETAWVRPLGIIQA